MGNLLPAELVDERTGDPTLNFLRDPSIWNYAKEVIARVAEEDGTLESDRLSRNLLSSMPLCFNLFGYLRKHLDVLAAPLSQLLDMKISKVTGLECEWAPPRNLHLRDKTAFDAIVFFESPSREKGFLGVETKYSEPFGTRPVSHPERYRKAFEKLQLKPTARADVEAVMTHQIWRNLLLVNSMSGSPEWGKGHGVVVALRDDESAKKVISEVNEKLVEGGVEFCAMEDLVAQFTSIPATSRWAEHFRLRYFPPSTT